MWLHALTWVLVASSPALSWCPRPLVCPGGTIPWRVSGWPRPLAWVLVASSFLGVLVAPSPALSWCHTRAPPSTRLDTRVRPPGPKSSRGCGNSHDPPAAAPGAERLRRHRHRSLAALHGLGGWDRGGPRVGGCRRRGAGSGAVAGLLRDPDVPLGAWRPSRRAPSPIGSRPRAAAAPLPAPPPRSRRRPGPRRLQRRPRPPLRGPRGWSRAGVGAAQPLHRPPPRRPLGRHPLGGFGHVLPRGSRRRPRRPGPRRLLGRRGEPPELLPAGTLVARPRGRRQRGDGRGAAGRPASPRARPARRAAPGLLRDGQRHREGAAAQQLPAERFWGAGGAGEAGGGGGGDAEAAAGPADQPGAPGGRGAGGARGHRSSSRAGLHGALRGVSGHRPPLHVGRPSLPGLPDALDPPSGLRLHPPHARSQRPVPQLLLLRPRPALHPAVPPGRPRLGRHRLQLRGGVRRVPVPRPGVALGWSPHQGLQQQRLRRGLRRRLLDRLAGRRRPRPGAGRAPALRREHRAAPPQPHGPRAPPDGSHRLPRQLPLPRDRDLARLPVRTWSG